MKIVIAGAGMVGYQVARTLARDGHDVVVIDPDGDVVRDVVNRLDCMAIQGRGNNLNDILKAGVAEAQYFIALTGSDEINIIACALAGAEFKSLKTIARVRSLDYGQGRLYQTLESGIDYLINPETETAVTVLTALAYGAVSNVNAFQGMDVQIRSLVLGEKSKYAGRRLIDFAREAGTRFLVPLIVRDEKYLIPSGDTELHPGDIIYLTAANADFDRLFSLLGKSSSHVRMVLLVGGTRINEAIAGHLCGQTRLYGAGGVEVPAIAALFGNRRVRIVEEDYERCKYLAEKFPKAMVVNGDISDESLFDEEQLGDCDVVIAATDHEERNIIAGLYAKRRGVRRAMALVYSGNYLSISRQLDLDVAISLRNSVANTIQGIIREGQVESVQALGDGSIEILEFVAEEGSRVVGKAIKLLTIPPETLIIAYQRGEASHIPDGNTELQVLDRVLVLTRKDRAARVQELFGVSPEARAKAMADIKIPE